MTLAAVVSPYQPINGLNGLGLNDGALYIGEDGQDPETHPQQCYWDAAGAVPAAQPVQILGGYPMRLGTPTRLYTASTFSIRVRDASGVQVFYEAHAVLTGPTVTVETIATLAVTSIPAAQGYVQTAGFYAAGDGGGALLRRVVGAGIGRWPSADGSYWEYVPAENGVNALAFGCKADAATDNAATLQSAIDFVRANAAYYSGGAAGLGEANASFVHLPAGQYVVRTSLDFTTDGTLKGLGIRGDGKLQTVILGELAEAYPVLDATGVSSFQFIGLQIRVPAGSAALCCLLIAQAYNSVFHNHEPILRDALLQASAGSGARAALVVQNGDLLTADNIDCDCETALGAAMGWLFVSQDAFPDLAQAGSINTVTLPAGASAVNGFYVGYPVRTISGTGARQIRQVSAYNGATKVATVTPAWAVAPDATTLIDIAEIRSKYRIVGSPGPGATGVYNRADQTLYRLVSSSFVGKKGLAFTAGKEIHFDGCYVAMAYGGDSLPCCFRLSNHNDADWLGPQTISGNLRTENQSVLNNIAALSIGKQRATIAVTGELHTNPNDGSGPGIGAVVRVDGTQDIDAITLFGRSDGGYLLDLGGKVRSLIGAFTTATGPGTCAGFGEAGRVGSIAFDWGQGSGAYETAWRAFLNTNAGPSVTGEGFVLPASRLVLPNMSDGAPNGALVYDLDVQDQDIAYVGGSGQGTYRRWTLPAGLFTGRNPVRRRLHIDMYGTANAAGTMLPYLRQGGNEVLLLGVAPFTIVPAPAYVGGNYFRMELWIEALKLTEDGTFDLVSGGQITVSGTTIVFAVNSTGLAAILDTADINLDLDVDSADNTPLSVYTRGFRVK